jgi:hypothetical protein
MPSMAASMTAFFRSTGGTFNRISLMVECLIAVCFSGPVPKEIYKNKKDGDNKKNPVFPN